MTKLSETLNRLDALHQLPDSHPIAQRERISLAHIDVAGILRKDRERFGRNKAKGEAKQSAAAAAFSIGQNVRTLRRMGADFLSGPVVGIDGGKVSVEIDGAVRVFIASALVAA